MYIQKWNYDKRDYEEYIYPKEWDICLYSEDMDKIVNCASCGKELRYGDTYTSQELHCNVGLGYGVCEECHNKEMVRKYSAKHE
jgi:hypothetical protein